MVTDYIRCYREPKNREATAIRNFGSLDRAIEIAALGQNSDGPRSRHHTRRTQEQLGAGLKGLVAAHTQIKKCKNFDELHDVILGVTRKIKWLGPLYTYDAARTIGTYLNLLPQGVYLHSGTKRGAKFLGFRRRETLQPSELPPELQSLKAQELEDFLCIYSNALKMLVRDQSPKKSRGS